jgi:predicted transcriptional regulator
MARPKKTPHAPRRKTVSFRLPDELMAQMRLLARKNRRTLSGEVQIALERHLQASGRAHSDLNGTDGAVG